MADIIVGIGEMKISSNLEDRIITFSLGSCLGLSAYDPVLKIGGIMHSKLPMAKIDLLKAAQNPFLFVDTGIQYFFNKMYSIGSIKSRLVVKIAGCANGIGKHKDNIFKIGERNYIVARKILWKEGILISGEDIGGHISRTMLLDISTGIVKIKSAGRYKII